MYDHMLNGRSSRQRHQALIREAQEAHLAQALTKQNQSVSQHVVKPIRRAAYLIAALIR